MLERKRCGEPKVAQMPYRHPYAGEVSNSYRYEGRLQDLKLFGRPKNTSNPNWQTDSRCARGSSAFFLHLSNEITTFLIFEGSKKCMSAQDGQSSSSGVRFSEGSVFCVGLMKYRHFWFSDCFSCCICGPICQHAKHPSEVRKTSNFIRPVQKNMPFKITLAEGSGPQRYRLTTLKSSRNSKFFIFH